MAQAEIVFANDFLARSRRNGLGEKLAHLCEHGQHFDFVEKSLRGLHVHELADAVGNLVERIHFEGELHAALGSELVDEQRNAAALGVLKQESRSAEGGAGA